jgi:hypothetical protein
MSEQERVLGQSEGSSTLEYEGWEHCGIAVEPSVIRYLRELGGGDISEGVRVAVRFHREHGREGLGR